MRLVSVVGTTVLLGFFVTAVPAYSQHGNRGGKDRDDKRGDREKPGKGHEERGRGPQAGREHGQPVREHPVERRGPARVEPAREHREVGRRVEPVRVAHDRGEHRGVWQGYRAREWAHEHRDWKARGGYHGYVIPRERYVVYFGPTHRFRMHTMPIVVVAGRPRFHYNGFWVTVVDPWPEYWAPSWYETDDVYVEYVHDGYYLYNAHHPGVAIAVNISL